MTITALQQGGRSYLALDVTHPDPPGTSGPGMPADPGCLAGSAAGCTGVYPRVAWELTDTTDEDANCPGGLVGDQCAPYWDLGWTWSPPAVGRVKVDGDPDDMFVAFFGGGWDDQNYKREAYSSLTGNFFYGVDVETGEIVYKEAVPGSMLPGGVATLDADADGFVDRVYFGDTTGGLWRLDVTAEATLSGTPPRVTNWTRTKIYQFPVEQEFFARPVVVPALFSGGGYTWAVAIGSGDRANVTLEDGVENRFYFVLDAGDNVTRTEANLEEILLTDPNVAAGTSYLNPPTTYGWFLHLRENEKVNADAIVAGQKVQFPTFEPTPIEIDPLDPRCVAVGTGRLYEVFYSNANSIGDDGQQNPEGSTEPRDEDLGQGLIAGGTAYTIGDTTVAQYTTWEGRMEEREIALFREHVVTNWRQD
jgi:Tfp pilus tip-associated adhesin PilY1